MHVDVEAPSSKGDVDVNLPTWKVDVNAPVVDDAHVQVTSIQVRIDVGVEG